MEKTVEIITRSKPTQWRSLRLKLRRLLGFNHEGWRPYAAMRWRLWCLYVGLRNCWRFRSVVWHFDTCDYAPLMDMLSTAARLMATHHQKHGKVTSSERSAKQLLIVSELCRRLEADDYPELAGYEHAAYPQWSSRRRTYVWQHAEYLAQQDIDYLGRMLKKHLRGWWD